MNNIYKVIWSKAKNCYVVASEIARSHTKSASGSEKIGGVTRRALLASLMALSLLCGGLGVASAVDGTVHVNDIEATATSKEVYTAGKVDALLANYGTKTNVDTNKANIKDLQNTTTTQGQKITENTTNIANNTAAIEKKIDKETAEAEQASKANAADVYSKTDANDKFATKEALNDKADKTTVTALEGRVGDVAGKVAALEGKVGDASGGLVKEVNDLKTQGNDLNIALGNKADKADLNHATNRIAANEDEITALKNKTGQLSADGKELKDMTTVSGTTVSGANVEANALKVTGVISNGAGVTTTLEKIDASMKQTETNKKDIATLQGTTNGQADAIKDLKDRTTNISYDSGKRSTSINGIDIGDTQVDMNGKNLTDVGTINGIDLGTKQKGNYISQDGSIWGNMLEVDDQVKTNADAIAKETADRKAAIGELAVDGKYIKKGMNVSDNLVELDKQAKTNADNIQTNANNIKNNKDEIARVNGELVKTNDYFNKELGKTNDYFNKELGKTNDYFNKELSKTNDYFNTELGKTNAALQEEGKSRAEADAKINTKIGNIDDTRTEYVKNANSISQNLTTLDEKLQATNDRTGGIKRNTEDTQTTIEGKVTVDNSGNVGGVKGLSAETINTTGNATIGGDLKVTGTITTDKMVFGDPATNNYTEIDKGHITSKNDVLAGDATKKSSSMELDHTKLEVGVKDKDSKGHLTMTADQTSIKNSDLDEKNYSEIVADKDSVTTTVKDEKDNTTSTKSSATEIRNYAKDKDGNESSIVQTGKDITNTAEKGTITNTAQNVTNEGTESVTNMVGANEVKVSKDGVDIKAEDGKKITESVGTASRVVENDKIADNAGGSTVTTEKGKGTTFGKNGSTDTTNIYGDSINTGKINAKDTTTDKLTAGVAADVDGGRLTVDADAVKGSYKSGNYTSKSYILANTLKSGVDNGKEPIDADFVGSRTDHYMDGDKAKLDETVKDAAGSNVTNKTSTGTVTTITDGNTNTTTKTEQGVKDITNTAKDGTITNDAKDIVNNAQKTITNTAGTSITNQVKDSKVTTDVDGTTFENKTAAVSDGGTITTKINGNHITTGRVDANELGVSDKDDQGNTAGLSVKAGEGNKGGIKGSVTDKDGNKTYTTVTATENSFQVQDKDGKIKNHQVNTKDKSENTITNGDKTNTVTSTAGGTIFSNSEAAAPVTDESGANPGTEVNTTIKGNTITTGKVTMDYADVMKDLGVKGNTTLGEAGKDTTLTVNSKATFNNGLTVTNGETKLKNTTIEGTLNVFENATFQKDVTANSFSVNGKTYIDSDGLNANNQVIRNVADGSISEGSKDAVNGGQLYQVKNDLEGKVNKVGANAAAMANLHPMEFDPDSKWNIAAAMGNYGSETATAIGAFYRPNEDVMVNFSTAFGTGENMVGGGVSVRLGKGGNKLSRQESNALKAQVDDLTARMDALLSVLNPNMSKDFPDVPENHWAYEAVSRLAGNDIVQGYPDGEFHGDRTMTRYEMAEIIYNALSRGAEAERELVEEFKPELQAMAASEKATAERAEG